MRPANRLLNLLSDADYAVIEPAIETLELPLGMELSLPKQTDRYCYFPATGVGSTVLVSPTGVQSEVGLFGSEGMSPASSVLGSEHNPYRIVMQVAGEGARIPVGAMRALLDESLAARNLFFRWAQVASLQISFTALANANHTIEERLARWILMCHDRINDDELHLTHDFLAIMLSVRRPSVTTSLHVLEGKHLINSYRGTVIVRDREGLRALAADAYGGSEAEYDRLLRRAA